MGEEAPVRIELEGTPTGARIKEIASRTAGEPHRSLELSFDQIDALPPESIAGLVDLIDRWLSDGRRVHLQDAPQMLAHTLYKVGRLKRSTLLTMSMRLEEPYPS